MLKKKMLRDIKKNLSQFITIFLMVLIGIMAYSGIEAYMDGMKSTADKFYTENNLQDLNLTGYNFTKQDLIDIKNIDNVKDAERKLSITALTNNDKTLLLNIIESNNISKFYVVEGIPFDNSKKGIWLDEFYAKKNDIKVGDKILVKYEQLELEEEVLALINVPDHLYDVRDSSELYPNRKEFGFAYMSTVDIPNELIVYPTVMVDVDDTSKRDEVKTYIEDNIKSVLAVIEIEDTTSYQTYQGEIDEGKTYVGVFSGLFLFIAMLSVITTMNRVVKNQRIQIGTLKALGFTDKKVLMHYIGYGFWISLIATICGLVLGYFAIGGLFISLEMDVFEIPNGHPVMNNTSYLVALLVILTVIIISYLSCKNILKENTAETLRNKIPNVKKNSLNITTKGMFKKLSFASKWNIRDILRNKMRTVTGIAGVTGCAMLIVCAFGMLDSMNYFVKLQFEDLYNFDYKLNLKRDVDNNTLNDLYEKYGSKTSESFLIEIEDKDNNKEQNNIMVTDAKDYLRFVNNKGNFIDVDSKEGVYITYKLASTKGYKIGDTIKWRIYGYGKEYISSKIVGFNKDPQNQNITMTKEYFNTLGIEGVNYKPDSIYTNVDLKDIKDINGVEVIQNIDALKEGMSNMLSMMKEMLVLIISIAILLGVIIIYNLGILSYTEKQYQFATLKVLGFKDKQIKKIFIKQNNWIAIISIIIGIPFGYYLTDWLFKTAIEEHYDFGASISVQTYIISAIGTFVISYVVSKILAKKINDIDMVSSLKGNE